MKDKKDKKNIKIDNEDETSTNGRKSERDYSGVYYDDPAMISTKQPPKLESPIIEAMSGSLETNESGCLATTGKGTQCTRDSVNNKIPFCWQHARQKLERTLWGVDLETSDDDLTPTEVIDIVLGALGDDDESVPPVDNPIIGDDETCSICGRPPEDQCDSGDDDDDAPSDPLDPIIINPILLPGSLPVLVDTGTQWDNPSSCPETISTYDLNHLRPNNSVGMYCVDPRFVYDGGHNVIKIYGYEGGISHWLPGDLSSTQPDNPLINHFATTQNWPIESEAGDGAAMGSHIGRGDWLFVWDAQDEIWVGRPIHATYSSQSDNQIQISVNTSFGKTYLSATGALVRILIFAK
jgi:hypothetical protein